jgi:hypothetical protein
MVLVFFLPVAVEGQVRVQMVRPVHPVKHLAHPAQVVLERAELREQVERTEARE